ncbi:hypothetical protein CSB37_04300 [bacterium DOLZORAL124_38_8]|nr:MAG: hypothetical protein CSB37_04300 [bacterium DOLZORAL124_38_8]
MKKQKQAPKTLLRLRVPKQNETGPIAFEHLLSSLHGIISQNKHDSLSFEISHVNGAIFFYVAVPNNLALQVQSQFYAQYPKLEIELVPEYFVKKLIQNKHVVTTELSADKVWVYPFKRYNQFVDPNTKNFEDPLNALTAALSNLPHPTDSAVIQFTIKPVNKNWNTKAKENLAKVLSSKSWEWDFFQQWYQWAGLHPEKSKRNQRLPIKWALLALSSMFKKNDTVNIEDDQQEMSTGSHQKESIHSATVDKISRLAFSTNIRVAYIHSEPSPAQAETKLKELTGVFEQFSLPHLNHFEPQKIEHGVRTKTFKKMAQRQLEKPFILSQEEVATFFHIPTESVATPKIAWVECPKLEPPLNLPSDQEPDITLIGESNFRNSIQKYGLRPVDRRRHVYVIGKTGMGKSTLLENMIYSDIQAGKGVAVIDPHGDLAEAVLKFVPKNRTNDVVLFDPSDTDFPIAFNLLEGKNQNQRNMIASGLIGVIKKLNINSWGPRLEHFLRNTVLALVEAPDTTMLGITRMLVDPAYQRRILAHVKDPMVQAFWETEFKALAPAKRAEAVGPIQNKVGQFLSNPVIRNIVGQPKSTLDLRFAMDTGKIVICNLSKGKLGEDNSAMLGSLLITKFQLDAMSRADTDEKDRKDFYLYVDEFQNFATDSFATILSEARKYRLNLTMANQYTAQMSEEVSAAVFGNVGSLVSFQVGIDDAKVLSEQFDETRVSTIDIASLPKYEVYNRIMIDGLTSPVFSGKTLPPPIITSDIPVAERIQKLKNFSRQRYGKPRAKVEEKILKWTQTGTKPKENNDENKQVSKAAHKQANNKNEKKAPPKNPKKIGKKQ